MLEHGLPDAEVITGRTHVVPGRDLDVDPDRAFVEGFGLLDHDDGVGALGHRRTGEDAARLPGEHFDDGSVAGGDRLDDLELGRCADGVGRVDGEPVHRRVVERRHRLGRPHLLGQHQAERIADGRVDRRPTGHTIEDVATSFSERDHASDATGAASRR